MTYARIVAGQYAGSSGEVVLVAGQCVWVATTGGVVCVSRECIRIVDYRDC